MLMNMSKIKNPLHPALVMNFFWGFICLVYFLGPIYLTPAVSLSTFLFLALHLALFTVGTVLFSQVTLFKRPDNSAKLIRYIPDSSIYRLITVILFVGICGVVMSVYFKLSLLGSINFASISELRTLRAQALLNGAESQSGLMSALSFLTYPAGFVGIVATIIFYEKIYLITRILSFFYVVSLIALVFCLGGRSPLMVLFIFIGAAFYVRGRLGVGYIPKSIPLRLMTISLFAMFIVYSSFIWIIRTKEAGMTTNVMLEHAANVWGAHPKDYLIAASERLGDPGLTQTILSSTFYFIQNLSISERLLSSLEPMPTMYGAYQIDLLAAIFRTVPSGAEFLKNGYSDLLQANIYGFFTGAWSGLYLDLGVFSFLAALLWGVVAGRSWRDFKNNPNFLTGIKYIFWFYSIFISFVSSPFGFSNSFMIFLWFYVFLSLATLFARYKLIPPVYAAHKALI